MFGDAMVDVRHLAVEAVGLCHFLVFKIFFRSAWMLSLQHFFVQVKAPAGM
jgi:hypothetical protein